MMSVWLGSSVATCSAARTDALDASAQVLRLLLLVVTLDRALDDACHAEPVGASWCH